MPAIVHSSPVWGPLQRREAEKPAANNAGLPVNDIKAEKIAEK